jgi:hypothetical protein
MLASHTIAFITLSSVLTAPLPQVALITNVRNTHKAITSSLSTASANSGSSINDLPLNSSIQLKHVAEDAIVPPKVGTSSRANSLKATGLKKKRMSDTSKILVGSSIIGAGIGVTAVAAQPLE